MKRWPLNKSYFWERAPFFRALMPLTGGILAYDYWNGHIKILLAALLIVGIICAMLAFFWKKEHSRNRITFVWANLLFIAAGMAICAITDFRNNPSWFGRQPNGKAYLARVIEAPIEKENSWKVPVSIIGVYGESGSIKNASGNALLYFYKDHSPVLLGKGDSIIIPGNWQPIRNAGNPFEFDYAAYCRRYNIFFQQVLSENDMRLYATNDPARTPTIQATHDWCMRTLDKYLPDHETKGLIQAMLLGDEVNLDESLIKSYSDTGIVHIIAISGGNVAIFFFIISFLLFWLRNRRHWVKYLVALPIVWFYVLMVGAPPSAIRAAIMFSLLAFGIMLQKNNNSLNQLFSTAFILLCAQPMWLFSVGFQLSFTAVLSLILFYTPIYNWLSPKHKVTKNLWKIVTASLAAEILVAPLVIYYFHTFPLLFIVANVIAYLFMGLALILGIVIIVVSFSPIVASFIGYCTTGIVTFFDKIVNVLQGINPSSFHFLVLTALQLMLVYLIIASFVLFMRMRSKWLLFSAIGLLCSLCMLFCVDEWESLHQNKLVVYNTGRAMHVELIHGKRFSIAYTDTTGAKKIAYATLATHTYMRAWQEDTLQKSTLYYVNGKSVLLLDSRVNNNAGTFPVKYLVINNVEDINAGKIAKIFSPEMIILGNGIPREEKNDFTTECGKLKIETYDIAENGAFVLN